MPMAKKRLDQVQVALRIQHSSYRTYRRFRNHPSGTHKLMAQWFYGSGLRRMECVRLRVKDVDLEYINL